MKRNRFPLKVFSDLERYSAIEDLVCFPAHCDARDSLIYRGDYRSNYDSKICPGCKGIVFTFVFICNVCDTVFLQDFYHPAFCKAHPVCWDCISVQVCGCKLPTSDREIELPLGLNPPKFTPEELDRLFDAL